MLSHVAIVNPRAKCSEDKVILIADVSRAFFEAPMHRNVAVELREDSRVTWFSVRAENYESIHNHNAFAEVVLGKE